ncbi:MAG: putative sugar nucleotidyltransferase and phosphatidyltransferase (Bifunctional enzyme) [Nitrospira sp.]|nr:putative sugar nucleotidyltransferase and phosphatidyltransferase (Bifunctional enzyme) [Nitrospira sp.]
MTGRALDKATELHGLSTAILMPSIDLFGAPVRKAVDPLTPVVGVGLFQRTVLTLQRAGIRQLIVVSGQEEDHLKQALLKGPRVSIPVRWMPIREFPLDDARTWESLAAEVRGFCLLSGVATVFSRSLIEQLRRDVQEGLAVIVTQSDQPAVQERWLRDVSSGTSDGLADVLVVPATELSAAAQLAGKSESVPISRWLQRALVDGRVRVMSTDADPSCWYQPVVTLEDLHRAEHRLYSSLKSEFEGFVDRYFNRIVSRWCTRWFIAMGWSPNVITLAATVIGLLSAAGFALGTYTAGVAAALLFQLAAVIDCSDGEVARLTFTESPFGAWLDMTLDNVVHMAIFGGIGIGVYLKTAGSEYAWLGLVLGAAAILGNALSFALVNKAQKITTGREWNSPRHAAWSEFMLKNLASRDFSVIVLLFAVFGKLEWFLWIAAVGSMVFAVVMLWIVRPSGILVRPSR